MERLIFGGGGVGLSTERNLSFQIDLASLTVGSKFTVFALFYFASDGNFLSTSLSGGAGDLTGVFLRYHFGGLYLEGLIH